MDMDKYQEEMTIGYLTSRFPCLTHTFISREIREMEKLGMNIRRYSVHRPAANMVSEEDTRFLQETFYVFPLKVMEFLSSQVYFVCKRPLEYFRILAFVTSRPGTRIRQRVQCFYHFCEAIQLGRRMQRDRIRHLHVHFVDGSATIALVLNRLIGLSYSLTAHGTALLVEGLLLKEKIRPAKFVIAISHYNRKRIVEWEPESREKTFLVYSGVDAEYFSPKETKDHDRPFTILNVGSLKWQKAHSILIAACKRLSKDGKVFRCLIVGEGPERNNLQALIDQNDLRDKVHLIGKVYQENIIEYYQNADLFVLSSISEGLPVVLMEAMAAQLPVIGTNITGIPEIIEEGNTGFMVDPGNDQELHKKIRCLMEDEALRIKFGENGRRKVIREFEIHDNAKKLRDIFEKYTY